MNANLFKSAIAALALATLTFNSCKDKEETEEEYQFPYEKVTLTLEDGMVFTDIEKYRDANFISIGEKDYSKYDIYMGTSPDSCQEKIVDDIKPFTKYYWYVVAHEPNKYDNTAQSEIRTFYYVTTPKITKVYNPEGDWATILKWEHNDYLKEATITLTPDKDCQYDKTPIVVNAAQDSCYISAGGEFNTDNQKYAVYHQWWDDSKAQYYEPVVYSFNVKFRGEIDGHSYSVTSDTVKYIFLDRAKYAADKQFNVYRMGRIGTHTWLLEDLRGIPTVDGKLADGFLLSYMPLAFSPLGYKARVYSFYYHDDNTIIPDGFHLATDDDWQDLEYSYGLQKTDCSNYTQWIGGNDVYSCTPPHNSSYYYKWKQDTNTYVGAKYNILYNLISKNEWVSTDSIPTTIYGIGGFNARPYGTYVSMDNSIIYQSTSVAFITSTTIADNMVIRVLWSGSNGIARIKRDSSSYMKGMYRCVKNE
jgi:hypothetical protein